MPAASMHTAHTLTWRLALREIENVVAAMRQCGDTQNAHIFHSIQLLPMHVLHILISDLHSDARLSPIAHTIVRARVHLGNLCTSSAEPVHFCMNSFSQMRRVRALR